MGDRMTALIHSGRAVGVLFFGLLLLLLNLAGAADISSCTYINTPDDYLLTADLIGNKSDGICITINTSNVTIDCNGYSITGDYVYTGLTIGIGNYDARNNVTIKNCYITNYTFGIYANLSNQYNITNNSLIANGKAGIFFDSTENSTILSNTINDTFWTAEDPGGNYFQFCYWSSANFYKFEGGIILCSSNYTTISYNYIKGNGTCSGSGCLSNHNGSEAGIFTYNSRLNNITYNIFRNSGDNYDSLYFYSYDTNYWYNDQNGTDPSTGNWNVNDGIKLDNSKRFNISHSNFSNNYEWGIFFTWGDDSYIYNNTASYNQYVGIRLARSANNTAISNTAFQNQEGFRVEYAEAINNTLANNIAYNNSYYGFYLSSSSNNTFTNNSAYSNSRYGFYLASNSNNNNFTNNSAYGNFYEGFYFASSSNNTFTNNSAYSNSRYGFYLASNSNNNNFTNNFVYENSYNGVYLHSSSNNTFTNNTAYSNQQGFYLFLSSNNTLTNNSAYNNTYSGLVLYLSSNNILIQNNMSDNIHNFYIYGSSWSHFIQNITTNNIVYDSAIDTSPKYIYYYVNNCTGDVLYCNTQPVPMNAGFFGAINSRSILAENLTMHNNSHGALIYNSTNITLRNSEVFYTYYSVYLYYSSNNTFTNNSAYSNSYNGFYLFLSSNNTFTNNSAYDNTFYGFYLASSSTNTLSNNFAYNNPGYQIYLTSSSNTNSIYNNIFNASAGQGVVYDDSSNFWNTSYSCSTPNIIGGQCIGGNFYSNYTGVDDGSGASYPHNIGGDGIGDNPENYYIYGGSNIDYLPLTNNYTNNLILIPAVGSVHGKRGEPTVIQLNLSNIGVGDVLNVLCYPEPGATFIESITPSTIPLLTAGNSTNLTVVLRSNFIGSFNGRVFCESGPHSANSSIYYTVTGEEGGGRKEHKIYIHPINDQNAKKGETKNIQITVENTGDYAEINTNLSVECPDSFSCGSANLGTIGEDVKKNAIIAITGNVEGKFVLKAEAKSNDAYAYRNFYFTVLPECIDDSDCPANQTCQNGTCVKKKEKEKEKTVADCKENEELINGSCVPIVCICGEIRNHECIPYECCKNEDCAANYLCIQHTCTKNKLNVEVIGKNMTEGEYVMVVATDLLNNPVKNAKIYTETMVAYTGEDGVGRIKIPYSGVINVEGFGEKVSSELKITKLAFIRIAGSAYLGEEVEGNVIDSKNNPIGVVELFYDGKTIQTDENSQFKIKFDTPGAKEISGSKYNYFVKTAVIDMVEPPPVCYFPCLLNLVELRGTDIFVLWATGIILGGLNFAMYKKRTVSNQLNAFLYSFGPLILSLLNIWLLSICFMANIIIIQFIAEGILFLKGGKKEFRYRYSPANRH